MLRGHREAGEAEETDGAVERWELVMYRLLIQPLGIGRGGEVRKTSQS